MSDTGRCRVRLLGGPQDGREIDLDRVEPPGVTLCMPRIPEDGPMVEDRYLWTPSRNSAGLWLATFTGTRAIPEPDPEWLECGDKPAGTTLSAERIAVIEKVADLWRGDWSGREFDGKEGSWWLRTALNGSDEELAEVRDRMEHIYD